MDNTGRSAKIMFGIGKNGNGVAAQQEFAVIGLGRFGSSVARVLVEKGHTVLGIDRDAKLVQRYSHSISQTASLDTTDEEALKEIDIQSYDTVIVAIGQNFEANLMTTAALKSLEIPNVICKATTEVQRDILRRIGADQVVLPEFEAGERLANNLVSPSVVSQMALCPGTRISEMKVPANMVGRSLEELDIRTRFDLNVVAIQRGEQVLVTPKKGTVLRDKDFLVVIGSSDAIVNFGAA